MLTQEQSQSLLSEAGTIIGAVIPILGPYGPALQLALGIAEKAAPAVYAEILALLKKGNTTEEENAYVRGLIDDLKHPEKDYEA